MPKTFIISFPSHLNNMNLLQLPANSMDDLQNLQIWDNAAFADGDEAALPLRPISGNRSTSPGEDLSKENQIPRFASPPLSKKAPSPSPAAKSFVAKTCASKKPSKVSFKDEPVEFNGGDNEGSIDVDEEIEEVKKEIARLSSRLEALRVKKAQKDLRSAGGAEKRGRIVPAKFLDTKQGPVKNLPATPGQKRVEQGTPTSATSFRRRGLSLGPLDILSATPAKVLDLGRGSAKKPGPSATKKTEATPASTQSARRRGMSLGPLELMNVTLAKVPDPSRAKNNLDSMAGKKREETPASSTTRRRGVSLGPLEIHESIRPAKQEKPNRTPIRSVPWPSFKKLAGIEEEKETSSIFKSHPAIAISGAKTVPRGGLGLGTPDTAARAGARKQSKLQGIKEKEEKGRRSSSASPKPQCRSSGKALELRKGVATVGATKPARRVSESLGRLKPNALFQDGGGIGSEVIPSKRPSKGRVVASRYSLATARTPGEEPGSKRRKWSLPELCKEEEKKTDGAPSESSGSLRGAKATNEGAETVDQIMEETGGDLDRDEKWARSIMTLACELPKIKNLRCGVESPRDSGCAKRVAQLADREPFFLREESPCCQVLDFEEDED